MDCKRYTCVAVAVIAAAAVLHPATPSNPAEFDQRLAASRYAAARHAALFGAPLTMTSLGRAFNDILRTKN
jgi:hypothetical protein